METGGKTYVWCKVCAKFKTQMKNSLTLKGSAKTSALAFINGRNSVTKQNSVCSYSVIYTCLV